MAPRNFDGTELDLFRNQLESITDEMWITVVRTAFSTSIRETKDFSAALCTPTGEMAVAGSPAIPDAMQVVRSTYGDELSDGDVVILNDPYHGGMHLPDIFLFCPVFSRGSLLGYSVTTGHYVDVGGRVPGSVAPDSTEIYQEGLRIPPLRLYAAGEPDVALFALITENVRVPDKFFGDMEAQLAAHHVAGERLRALDATMDEGDMTSGFDALLDYSERIARASISSWPDGSASFRDFIDDDGVGNEDIAICVTITIDGDELLADFTGSSPQVASAINSTPSFVKGYVYNSLRCMIGEEIAVNEGFYRPVRFVLPPGSIVNPNPPSAVASRGVTGFRVESAVHGAFAQVLDDVVRAQSSDVASIRLGGYRDGASWVVTEVVVGSTGAFPSADGIDGTSGSALSNNSIEHVEAGYPMDFLEYGFVPDTGGPGRHRGGLSVRRSWRCLADEATLTVRTDRVLHPPWGLAGGSPGAPTETLVVEAATGETHTMRKGARKLHAGDVVIHRTAGGGGYGDPFERDPELVLADWVAGKVSAGHACAAYGVVIDEAARSIDEAATRAARDTRPLGQGPTAAATSGPIDDAWSSADTSSTTAP